MKTLDSTLEAVTVYAEGALCTRVAELPVDGGPLPEWLMLTGLPLALRPGSLRARVTRGPPGLSVLEVKAGFEAELPAETDLCAEQQALEAAEAQQARLSRELSRLSEEWAKVAALQPTFQNPKRGEPPRPSPVEAVLALAGFVEAQLSALGRARLEVQQKHKDAQEALALRRQRLAEASTASTSERAKLSRTARVRLSPCVALGPVSLELEYAVPGARWAPSYSLKLERNLGAGALWLSAQVAQRTGEDWSGVRLSLSTASLDRKAGLPELKSLRIGRAQPPPPRPGFRDPPPGLEELFSGFDAARGPPSLPPLPEPPARYPEAMPPPELAPEKDDDEAPSMAMELSDEESDSFSESAPSLSRSVSMGQVKGGPGFGARPSAPMRVSAPSPKKAGPTGARTAMASRGRSTGGGFQEKERAELSSLGEPAADSGPLEGGGGEPQREPGPEVTEGLLDYAELTMAGPESPSFRGQLRPVPPLEVVAVHSVSVSVVETVSLTLRAAQEVTFLPLPSYAVSPREARGAFDYRYDAQQELSVPSDGQWHLVPLTKVEAGFEGGYLSVPSVEPRVYRTVKVENRSPHALLAGPVDVTLGEEFLMTCPLPTLPPKGVQRMGLGVEEGVKVSRHTHFEETAGGVFGGSTLLSHRVQLEVSNRLAAPILLEVREKVSVAGAGQDDIKVEERDIKPAWQPLSPEVGQPVVQGERVWRVSLAAGEKQQLSAAWAVKIPGGTMLVGGNRRV